MPVNADNIAGVHRVVSLWPLAKCGLEAEAAAWLDSSMTKLDFKSAVIGFLSATTLVAGITASGTFSNQTGRYVPLQARDYIGLLDTRTGVSYQPFLTSAYTPAAEKHAEELRGR